MVERCAAVNDSTKDSDTPLMVAAHNAKLKIFRYHTEFGADINIPNTNKNKNSALHLAAASGSVDIFILLLDKGMSVNLTNIDECTPLHISAQLVI